MLLTTIAFVALVVMPFCYFSFEFVRMLGAHQQQRTAIDAAAMAAARDASRIVVEDPNCGFVSLSDDAPDGKATKAGDNFFTPVRSINTILATTRLDMIIADQLNSTIMRQCAEIDYQNAIGAKNRLVTTLQKAFSPQGCAFDKDGNVLSPLSDAQTAYETNLIRMNGNSQPVPNSFKLTLGCETGLYTITQYPQPLSIAAVTNQTGNENYYKAFVNVPYTSSFGERDFVFAAIASNVTAVDFRLFQPTMPALPYLIPSVVKCEADQTFTTTDQYGKKQVQVVHAIACAEPSSLGDHLPEPGAMAIDFPTGGLSGITCLQDMFSSSQIMKCPTDLLFTALLGDSPPQPLSGTVPAPLTDEHVAFGGGITLCVYDWIRNQGTALNVASLVSAFKIPFDPGSTGHEELFQADLQGNVQHTEKSMAADVTMPISQMQPYGRSGVAFMLSGGNATFFDVYIKDYVYQPGRILGGNHAGQPLEISTYAPGMPDGKGRQIDEYPTLTYQFPTGPPNGAVRPTYQNEGIAVDILFRVRTPPIPWP